MRTSSSRLERTRPFDQLRQIGDSLERIEESLVVDVLIKGFELASQNQVVRYLGSDELFGRHARLTTYLSVRTI
jgi:hypothetical protein